MTTYEEARKMAETILELEKTRSEAQEKLKIAKDELLTALQEENMETMFDLQDGLVYLDSSTNYKIPDGLLEEVEAKSKSPDKISQDFIDNMFMPDLKLSKKAKRAIKDEDSELLSVLVPTEKVTIKVKLR